MVRERSWQAGALAPGRLDLAIFSPEQRVDRPLNNHGFWQFASKIRRTAIMTAEYVRRDGNVQSVVARLRVVSARKLVKVIDLELAGDLDGRHITRAGHVTGGPRQQHHKACCRLQEYRAASSNSVRLWPPLGRFLYCLHPQLRLLPVVTKLPE